MLQGFQGARTLLVVLCLVVGCISKKKLAGTANADPSPTTDRASVDSAASSGIPLPYHITNAMYENQADSFANIIAAFPLDDSLDTAPGWVGTTNFSMRRPNFVILHHTAQDSCEQTLRTFTLPHTQVSSHYVVCRDGMVHHMLNDYLRGHHAGLSRWGNSSDLNSSSIGIEIDNNGFEPFTYVQLQGLIKLLEELRKSYNIPQANFIGHADIAPGRKVDPSRFFPWKELSDHGFGNWYDTIGIKIPEQFDPWIALRVVGYNISDSLAAVQSFKIHFQPEDLTKEITPATKKILYSLMNKAK